MKNKSLPVIIGIILLLLIGGGAFVFMGKKSVPVNPSVQTQTDSLGSVSTQSSLKDLLLGGKAQTCTYTDKLEGSDITGTSYMASGKMRSDFDSVINGKTMSTHMIMDGNTSYTWTDGQATGFKMTINPDDLEKDESVDANTNSSAGRQSVDVNKVIDYKCGNWTVDNSLFIPPSDIKFTDFSTMMKPQTDISSAPQVPFNNCGICENQPEESKQACRTALKCD